MSKREYQHTAIAGLMLLTAPVVWAADDASSEVEKCSKSFGVIAVAEPKHGWHHLRGYGLNSPAAIIRMMIQKSGCFDVAERGVGMENLKEERALAESGELRQESNVGKGQMQAADFVMTPDVQVAAKNTGGVGAAVGSILRRIPGVGAIGGGLKFKEASTSILIADVRSSLQVAAAEGKASKTDFSVGGWGFAGGAVGALGGYTDTPEGKVIAASFLDNYNKIVLAIRDQPTLLKQSSAAGDANAASSTKAGAPVAAGQVLRPKIANVKVFEDASRDSKVLGTLQKGDDLVATGEVKNDFIQIDSANASGWVQRTLVSPYGR